MTHTLKTWPLYFDAVIKGDKTFELRRNDRDYKVGDTLILQEYGPESGYSGREETFIVTYLFSNAQAFGLEKGYVCMGITPKTY